MSENPTPDAPKYPLLAQGVRAEPIPGKPGELRVTGGDSGYNVTLGESAFVIARQFDGSRSCDEIKRELEGRGINFPSPDFIEAMAQALARVGLVKILDKPSYGGASYASLPKELRSLHPLNHQCFGCGRSCQGHLVGPLEPEYVEKLQGIHAQLEQQFDDLKGLSPTRTEVVKGQSIVATAIRPDGTCIYLGDDNLCRIHKVLGSAAKPMVCRLFPLTMVQTEDEVRVGVPLRCYLQHKTYRDPVGMSPAEMTGMEPREFPSDPRRGMDAEDRYRVLSREEIGGAYLRTLKAEELLLSLLQNPQLDERMLLDFGFEVARGQRLSKRGEPLTADHPFVVGVVQRANRLGHRLSVGLQHIYDISKEQSHAHEIRQLSAFLRDLTPRSFEGLTLAQRDYGFYVMREWFFVREWVLQPSFYVSVFLVTLGLIFSSWRSAQEEPGVPADQVGEVFSFSLATWMRLMRIGTNIVLFVRDEDDFQELIRGLDPDAR